MAIGYNPSNWQLTKRLLGYMKPFLGVFIVVVVTAFGREPMYQLLVPLLIMLIVDYILLPVPDRTNWFLELLKVWTGTTDRFGLLAIMCLLIVAAAIVRGFFFSVHRIWRGKMSQGILRDMRRDFYRCLLNKSFSYLSQVRTGQIISRMTSDMGAIDLFYSEAVRESFRMTMQFLLTLCILLTFDVGLTVLCCLPLLIIFISTRLYSSKVQPYMTQSKREFDSLNSLLVEGIVAQKLVKALGQQERFSQEFKIRNNAYLEKILKASIVQSLYRPSSSAIAAVGTALVIFFGGLAVLEGQITIGALIVFGTYFTQLVGPVRMFSRIIDYYQDAVVSAKRVFEVMDIGEDVPEAENPIELPKLNGAIEFEGVFFAYESSKETLKNISLTIKPGERVALVGYVGSGKTTLAELVPRFYDVSSGRVTVDGYDVRQFSLKSLRSQIGIVMQDIYVFSSTIRENIAYGKPTASDEEVEKAAKAAQIHDFVMTLPEGYNSVVGERGLTLSGGQRQRIAIARMLLSDPKILILDDSTSNVDAETEMLIGKAVEALLEGRTALIITQRASTCEAADRVIVMDEGEIIAVGKHSDLQGTSEKYQQLIESQILELIPEADGSGGVCR